MSTKWDQTMEHVFHNEGIIKRICQEYPHVYKLLHEELQSTAAYLNFKANMQSISYRSPIFQGDVSSYQSNSLFGKKNEQVSHYSYENNSVTLISQSVENELIKVVSRAVAVDVGKTIADECLKTLPQLKAVPPGGHCLVANRTNGVLDSTDDTLIWSIGYNLRLTGFTAKKDSVSSQSSRLSPTTKKEYLLDGTLNVYTFCTNRAIIVNLEKRAQRDYYRAKDDVLQACPQEPMSFEPSHQSITEKTSVPQFPSTYQSNSRTSEEVLLEQSMAKTHDYVVSILTIKERNQTRSMSRDIVTHTIMDMKSHIQKHLTGLQETFIVRNHLITVYSFSNTRPVFKLLEEIHSSLDAQFNQSSQSVQSPGEFTVERLDLNKTTFDDVMRRIHD